MLGPLVKGLNQGSNAPLFGYADPVSRARVIWARMTLEKELSKVGGKYGLLRMQFAHYSNSLHNARLKYENSTNEKDVREALSDIQFFRERVQHTLPEYNKIFKEYTKVNYYYNKVKNQEEELRNKISVKEKIVTGIKDFFY